MQMLVLTLLWAASPLPLLEGQWWEYLETYTELERDVSVSTDDTTRVEVRLTASGPYLRQAGGSSPAPGLVEFGETWIRLPPWTGEDVLPLPLEVGRVGQASADGEPGWTVEAEEDVVVPAGRFRALRCAIRSAVALSLLWIAPGVGIVREWHGSPNGTAELERELSAFGGRPGSDRPSPPR